MYVEEEENKAGRSWGERDSSAVLYGSDLCPEVRLGRQSSGSAASSSSSSRKLTAEAA